MVWQNPLVEFKDPEVDFKVLIAVMHKSHCADLRQF